MSGRERPGWVLRRLVRLSACASFLCVALSAGVAAEQVAPASDEAVLRAAPADDAAVLARLQAGQPLEVVERSDGWLRVAAWVSPRRGTYERVIGWIRSEDSAAAPDPAFDPRSPPATAPESPPPVEEAPPVSPPFELRVDGSPALKFALECHDGTRRILSSEGLVPDVVRLVFPAVRCRAEKLDFQGRLRIELWSGRDLVAVAETRDPHDWVRVASDGPWGPAYAEEGDRRVLLLPRRPFDPRLPPFFRGPPTGTISPVRPESDGGVRFRP